jgi:FAD/FMN-containing dehydrogenase
LARRHTPWAGANSIEGGVTIDLSNMKEVVISADRNHVAVGPGNRWGEVYPKLEEAGLAVSGGRWGNFMNQLLDLLNLS